MITIADYRETVMYLVIAKCITDLSISDEIILINLSTITEHDFMTPVSRSKFPHLYQRTGVRSNSIPKQVSTTLRTTSKTMKTSPTSLLSIGVLSCYSVSLTFSEGHKYCDSNVSDRHSWMIKPEAQ